MNNKNETIQRIAKLIKEFNQEWDQYYSKGPFPADLNGGVSVMNETPTNVIVVDFTKKRKSKVKQTDNSKKNRDKENKKLIRDWRLGPDSK